ncbi:MAG: hypothetical protein HYV63_00335 [Candidatus Schekmanbacteria bacterium]|nr:hypothetical protein [Candidatus Schekmanbacteria bacterium]
MRIYPESWTSKVGKTVFRTQDVQVGQSELDSTVMIKATAVANVQDLLKNAPLQRKILALFQSSKGFEINDWGIRHHQPGEILQARTARDLMDRMADVADELPGGRGPG